MLGKIANDLFSQSLNLYRKMDIKKRKSLRKLAGLGAVSALSPLLAIQSVLANQAAVIQGIRTLQGEVWINGRLAKVGDVVRRTDRITTGKHAHVVYVIGEEAYLQRDQSEVLFGESAQQFFRVVTGKLLAVFGRGEKTLHTPVATMGIRGTGCYFEVEPERTYFCLCYGWTHLQPTANPQHAMRYTSFHHDRPVYIYPRKQQPIEPVLGGVYNHTDDELLMLEALQYRSLPFDINLYSEGGYY